MTIVLLVFLLAFLNKMKAQTASSRQVTDFYSLLVKEKLQVGQHTMPVSAQQHLPGDNTLPQKVTDLKATAHASSGSEDRRLPADTKPDIDNIKNRNRKFIRSR